MNLIAKSPIHCSGYAAVLCFLLTVGTALAQSALVHALVLHLMVSSPGGAQRMLVRPDAVSD